MMNTETDKGSLSQVAWQTLLNDIVSGRLLPESRLRIGELRKTYGIGASPLREALSRLLADRFVVMQERKGFSVAPMSLAELRDLTDLRKVLEKQSLRISLEKGGDEWEAAVIGVYHRLVKAEQRLKDKVEGATEEWEVLNEQFHETLVSACDSEHLLRFRRMAYTYALRYRRVCLSITSVSRNAMAEHKALCDAALARDITLMCEIIDGHLEALYTKVAESGKIS